MCLKAVWPALQPLPLVLGLRVSALNPAWALALPVLASSIPASISREQLVMSAQGLPESGWNRAIGVARWIGLAAADFWHRHGFDFAKRDMLRVLRQVEKNG